MTNAPQTPDKKQVVINVLLLVILFAAVGFYVERPAGGETELDSQPVADMTAVEAGDQSVTLRIWAPQPMLEYEIRQFEAANPQVDIELTTMENEPRIADLYMDALAGGNAPDILVMTERMLGAFNSIDKLADLSSPPFELPEDYREQIGEYLWELHRSLDGSRMIAVPYDYWPQVLYYRADLLAAAGFPSEPDQLAAYLKEPAHWLAIASALQADGIATTEWLDSLMTALNAGQFLFDRDLTYKRSTAAFKAAYEIALQSRDTSANVTVWNTNGQALLREGKLAMIFMPAWGEENLAGWVPEQAGLWRATSLPFGTGGVDHDTSKAIAVASESEHKEIAAKFVRDTVLYSGSQNWNKNKVSYFLGNQNTGALYEQIVEELPAVMVPTPFDEKAFGIWNSSIQTGINKSLAVEDALAAAEQGIMDVVSVPLSQLLEYEGRADK